MSDQVEKALEGIAQKATVGSQRQYLTPVLDAAPTGLEKGSQWLLGTETPSQGMYIETGAGIILLPTVAGLAPQLGALKVSSQTNYSDIPSPAANQWAFNTLNGMLARYNGTAWEELIAVGVPTSATNRHEARYKQTSNQSIPNATDRSVWFNTIDYESADFSRTTGTSTTGSSFTCNRAGLVSVVANVRWPVNSALNERYIAITDDAMSSRWSSGSFYRNIGGGSSTFVSMEKRCVVGEKLRVVVWQSGGAAETLDHATGNSNGVSVTLAWHRP